MGRRGNQPPWGSEGQGPGAAGRGAGDGQRTMAATWADQGGRLFQANLKKFMEYIQLHSTDKVARLLDKGLDPNFHDPDSGGQRCSRAVGGWPCGSRAVTFCCP